jgi:hypothetical protein
MLIGVCRADHLDDVRGQSTDDRMAHPFLVTFLPLVGALFILLIRGARSWRAQHPHGRAADDGLHLHRSRF